VLRAGARGRGALLLESAPMRQAAPAAAQRDSGLVHGYSAAHAHGGVGLP